MVSFIVLAPSEISGTNNIVCSCNINLKNPYFNPGVIFSGIAGGGCHHQYNTT